MKCRSQCPRGLRHEPSLTARTLRSWVRIPLKAWMLDCLRLFWVCVVVCVGSGLATGWSLVQGVFPTVYGIKKLKKRPRFDKRTAEPQTDRLTWHEQTAWCPPMCFICWTSERISVAFDMAVSTLNFCRVNFNLVCISPYFKHECNCIHYIEWKKLILQRKLHNTTAHKSSLRTSESSKLLLPLEEM
jgi:hypothetical protein